MKATLLLRGLAGATLALLGTSCISYSGVSKADGQLYLTGGTTFVFFTVPFVKRCDIDGTVLRCQELSEPGNKPASDNAGTPMPATPSVGTPPGEAKKPPAK